MAPEFTIIRARPEHVDRLAPLLDAYRQFYQQASDVIRARSFLADRLIGGQSVVFFAQGAPDVLGFTQLYPLFSSVELCRTWLLNDLFVIPPARRLGVGEALLERARQFGLETGAKSLMLETAVDNLPAQRLYERMGWVRETHFYTYNLRV